MTNACKLTGFALAAVLAPALALAPAAVLAQDAASQAEAEIDTAVPGGQDIVVSGDREELNEQAREQARAITPRADAFVAPLARMHDPVCPGVIGVDEATAFEIIGRIRANADRVGHRAVRGEACGANVIVAFVEDPHAEFEAMRDEHHQLVDGLDFWEAKRIRQQEGPVLAWNVTSRRTRDGMASDGQPPVFASTASSRLELGVREDILASVVMIRRDAVAGLDTVALADYVTMRALAKTDATEGETTLGSILELFDESVEAPPFRLTSFDEAYLTSLYARPANTPSTRALRDVGEIMARGSQ